MELKGLFAPSCAGQLQSLMAGVGAVVAWPRLIGADDVVEVAKQLKQSGAGSLGEFMFRGEQLEQYRQRGSVLTGIDISHKWFMTNPKVVKPTCNFIN